MLSKMNVRTLSRLARKRRAARGVTLVEILIVLAIIGLIAGGIAVYAVPKYQKAQVDATRTSAKNLQQIAESWRTNHGNDCPTPQRLKDEKELSASSEINDAWGSPFKIDCPDESTTTVISSGPDKKENTQDDVRFPDTGAAK